MERGWGFFVGHVQPRGGVNEMGNGSNKIPHSITKEEFLSTEYLQGTALEALNTDLLCVIFHYFRGPVRMFS